MSRSDDGKCPDIGNWCSYPREICEGTCLTKEMEDLRAENELLKAALKEAIPWACLKCTFWNSRTSRCSSASGMCTQVWKWNNLLKGGAK